MRPGRADFQAAGTPRSLQRGTVNDDFPSGSDEMLCRGRTKGPHRSRGIYR